MLDLDMKKIIEDSMLCYAATINQDGSPNLSPKSTLRIFNDNHLIFANIKSPGTISNIKRDPRIEINCVDIFARRGYRFKGKGIIYSAGTKLCHDLLIDIRKEHGKSIPVLDAVLIEVLQAQPVLSPAYSFIEGLTEQDLKASYMLKYNVQPITKSE